MPDRVRVVHVIQNLNYGGMERVLSDIVLRCDRELFESHVLCLQYLGRFAEGLETTATLHVAKPMRSGSMLWPKQLADEIRALAPDVVHSHSGVWYKSSLASQLAGVPRLVYTEHGRANPDPQLAEAARIMVERAAQVRMLATVVWMKLYVQSLVPALPFVS